MGTLLTNRSISNGDGFSTSLEAQPFWDDVESRPADIRPFLYVHVDVVIFKISVATSSASFLPLLLLLRLSIDGVTGCLINQRLAEIVLCGMMWGGKRIHAIYGNDDLENLIGYV